ncbi:MAG: exosortase U [Planctomycetaceae bacterium]|nr:exosortase U [Planctomycetaceae bacterium]MCA9085977.1 exosortase U [Planctomycetaceae bacterium]
MAALTVVGIGFLPLSYWHIAHLLNKPHYQFLFLLPVAVWMLALDITTAEDDSSGDLWGHVLGLAVLITGLAGLTVAAWYWSPWLAAVSLMFAGAGLVSAREGWPGFRRVFPLWAFFWIIVPLPFGLDEDLIVRLRALTTRISSSVLDQLGVFHDSYANIIELPGKPLFIADACSGIHSLYVLLAAALFLAAYLRRSLMHAVLLLVSTFLLVLVENTLRIVLVAVLWTHQSDFSTGWKHEFLGILLFVVSMALVLSTDQLLAFLLPNKMPSLRNLYYRVRWGIVPEAAVRPKRSSARSSPVPAWLVNATTGLVAFFPVVGLGQLFRMPESPPPLIAELYDDFRLKEFGRESMPDEIDGFRLESYDTVDRVFGDPLGQASQQWKYRSGLVSVMISVDYPYTGVHDLCECYSAMGWHISDRSVVSEEVLREQKYAGVDGPVGVGHLERETFGGGLLLFNLIDQAGHTEALIKALARGDADQRASRRLESFGSESSASNAKSEPVPPWIQFQMFARTSGPPDRELQHRLTQFFLTARQRLKTAILSELGSDLSSE